MTASAYIEIKHTTSRLVCTPDILQTVKYFVCYQETALPPVQVQKCIRDFFVGYDREGGDADIWAVRRDKAIQHTAHFYSFDLDELNTLMLRNIFRADHRHDGWKRLVKDTGHFPTGLLPLIERALRYRVGITWNVIDRRGPRPQARQFCKPPSGYPDQIAAVQAFIAAGRGVADMPPRSGKTRVAIIVVCELGLPTLFVAPNKGLARQTAARFAEHLGDDNVACVTGGKQSARRLARLAAKLVWVATPKTALGLTNKRSRQVLIIDEFHHAAAATWKKLAMEYDTTWYRLGLTGTHFRADGRDMEMQGVLGTTVYSTTVSDMVNCGRVVPARIAMLRINGPPPRGEGNWYAAGIVDYTIRNQVLTWAARELITAGKRVLCLVKEVRHGEALRDQIPGSVFVSGESGVVTDQQLARLARREISCVIGTSVIGEGRDVPAADALVYFCGGKSRVKVTQDYFRVLTASPGKQRGIIVDAADCQSATLTEHAARRLQIYRAEPAFETSVLEWQDFSRWLT